MASLRLEKVNKFYDNKVQAIQNANLSINDKEFVVLVGPSGCGKSTLLRMIAGLEEISSGQLYIDDQVVNDMPPKDRDIAMVFQNYALYPHMSVYENMAFGLKLRKFPKEEIDRRVNEAAEMLGLSGYLDRKPKALSGGQRQRVAVGRAIVRKPKVFLFDEPLSNLDAKLRVQMRIEINRLHKNLQTTMVYVTHDQVEAMTMGERIVVLKDGVIQQVDTPLKLYENPKNIFTAGFIGSPAMNFFPGKLIHNGKLTFQAGSIKISLPDPLYNKFKNYAQKEIVLGVRPEHLRLCAGPTGFSAKVDVVEPMGADTFSYLTKDDLTFTIRIPSNQNMAVGEKIHLECISDKLHFFDPQSGKAL